MVETSIVEKKHQISNLVRQKVTQLLTEKESLTDIAKRLHVSTSTVYHKLEQFTFKEHKEQLPTVMFWDEQDTVYYDEYVRSLYATSSKTFCQTLSINKVVKKTLLDISFSSPTTVDKQTKKARQSLASKTILRQ